MIKLYKSKRNITTIKQSLEIIKQTRNTYKEMKSIVFATMASAVASAMDVPEDRCCILYKEKNFKGGKNTFCLDESKSEMKFDLYSGY